MFWTDERYLELWRMRAEGVSYTACGRHFGVTKNAIAGACHRIKLMELQTPDRFATAARPAPKKVSGSRSAVDDRVTPLLRLQPHDCRWPVGDPRDRTFRFCCAPRADVMRPYCEEHMAAAYVPVQPKKKSRPHALRRA